MNQLGDNIRYLRHTEELTQEMFGNLFDLNRGMVASYEAGAAEPDARTLADIVNHFNVTIGLLVYNNIEEEISQSVPAQEYTSILSDHSFSRGLVRKLAVTLDKNREKTIAYVPTQLHYNYSQQYNSPEFLQTLTHFSLPWFKDLDTRGFEINGIHMHPTLKNGAVVIASYVNNLSRLKKDCLYVVVHDQKGLTTQRLQSMVTEEGEFEIKPDHHSYNTSKWNIRHVNEFWAVHAVIRFGLDAPRSN